MAQLTNVLSSRYIYFNSKKFNYISLLSQWMVDGVHGSEGQRTDWDIFSIFCPIWYLDWDPEQEPMLAPVGRVRTRWGPVSRPTPHWTLELINQIFLICLCCNLLTRTSPLSRLNTPIRWPAPAPGHSARLKINCQQFCFRIIEGWRLKAHNPVI